MLAYYSHVISGLACLLFLIMLGLLRSLAVFALLLLNSEAFINLVMASYRSPAWLGYRGAGVNPERSSEEASRTASPYWLTTLRSNRSFSGSGLRGWRSFWPLVPVNAVDCVQEALVTCWIHQGSFDRVFHIHMTRPVCSHNTTRFSDLLELLNTKHRRWLLYKQ